MPFLVTRNKGLMRIGNGERPALKQVADLQSSKNALGPLVDLTWALRRSDGRRLASAYRQKVPDACLCLVPAHAMA